jgi:hypothetical protein
MGRYFVWAFMDVDGDGLPDLEEPFGFTQKFVEIPEGDMVVTVDINLDEQLPTSLASNDNIFEPEKYVLGNNYPNPFNPTTHFQYQIPESKVVTVKIFNLLGKEVKTLVHKKQSAGLYSIEWDGTDSLGKDVSSGIYIYSMKAGNFIDFKKMTLVR